MTQFHFQLPGSAPLHLAIQEDLGKAQDLIICSPWITGSPLCDRISLAAHAGVRSVVYTQLSDGISDGEALAQLHDSGVRIMVWGTNLPHFFHPKTYLIHLGAVGWAAWIGSANLTKRGMALNVEAMVRVAIEADELNGWRNCIDRLAGYCSELTQGMLCKYREHKASKGMGPGRQDELSVTRQVMRGLAPVNVVDHQDGIGIGFVRPLLEEYIEERGSSSGIALINDGCVQLLGSGKNNRSMADDVFLSILHAYLHGRIPKSTHGYYYLKGVGVLEYLHRRLRGAPL